MAARRSNRGRRRNRGRFGFLYKLLSVVVILAAIIVGCVVFFRVDNIEVEGNSRYSAGQIIEAAEVEKGDNLFALNRVGTYRQILERLPYVEEVAISCRLPDTLVIRVTERTAVAAIQGDGAWWILDEKIQILERTDQAGIAGYPQVTGLSPAAPAVGRKLALAEEQQHKLESLSQLLQALSDHGVAGQAESFDLTALNAIEMKYGGRFTVRLPMTTDFDRSVRAVIEAAKTLPENDTGILDFTLDENEIHLIPYS